MPLHERQEIRQAIITALIGSAAPVTYATSAGARVTKSRLPPYPDALLPAISVYTDEEETGQSSKRTAPRELQRVATVAVDAWVSASENIDDALDAIALQIETAMDADTHLGGKAFDSILVGTQIGMTNAGNRPMGCIQLNYEVVYHTDIRLPAEADEFDTVDVQFSLGGDQATADQAHDLVDGINQE